MSPVDTTHVRLAKERDLEVLPDVERDAGARYRDVGYDFCADGPVRSEDEHRRALGERGLWVAAASSGIVGFALCREVDRRGHLVELAVRCSHQGRGIGRALLRAVEDWASGCGFEEITLTTFRDVPWNAPFYQRCGYRVFDPDPDRHELAALRAEERAAGFCARPRVAMRKPLAI